MPTRRGTINVWNVSFEELSSSSASFFLATIGSLALLIVIETPVVLPAGADVEVLFSLLVCVVGVGFALALFDPLFSFPSLGTVLEVFAGFLVRLC